MWSGFANGGLDGPVYASVLLNGDLYVGGDFSKSFDNVVTLNFVGRYAGATWSALANNGLNGSVVFLGAAGSDLIAGGSFTRTKDLAVTLGSLGRYTVALNNSSIYLPIAVRN